MEIWQYEELEQSILENEKPDRLSSLFVDAICTLLTPTETAVLLALYDEKSIEQIAEDCHLHEKSVFRIRTNIAKKIESLFSSEL